MTMKDNLIKILTATTVWSLAMLMIVVMCTNRLADYWPE